MDGAVNPQLFPGNKSAGTSLNLTRRGYSPVETGANDGELDSRRRSKEATPRGIARCKFTLTSVAIGSTIWALKALLCSIDVVLTVSQPLLAMLATCFRALRRSKKQPPNVERARVVVIGASFAGLEAIHHLKARSDIDVVLVTDRPYFEYTPGILRCLVQPEHFHALACPLPSMSTHTIIGTAKSVASDQVKVVTAPDTHELVPFTHCLITVGNAYSEPMIKPSAELESTLLQRAATWKRANAELLIASSVLVVGGGLVGVELAAEIAVALPHIAVTLVHSHTELCNELPASARAYIRRWLKTRGVDLRLGRRVTKMEPQHCLLDDGSLVTFSLVYRCTGGRGQSNLEGCGSEALGTQRKGTGYYLRTNENLEVVGRRAVWAAGDSMMMQTEMDGGVRDGGGGTRAGREVKNAHTAEQTAKLAAWNILRSLEGHTRAVPEVRAATQAARAMKDKVLATGAEAEGARLASIQDKAVAGVDAADNGAGRASSLKDVQGRRGNAPRGAGAGGESGRDGLLRYPEGLAGIVQLVVLQLCFSLCFCLPRISPWT